MDGLFGDGLDEDGGSTTTITTGHNNKSPYQPGPDAKDRPIYSSNGRCTLPV